MKGILVFIAVVTLSCSAQKKTIGKQTVFQSVTVIPMDTEKERVIENAVVVVQDGKIISVGDSRTKYDKNATVIDGRGKFLIPGLAEMHAHVPPVENLEPMKEVLLLFAANGITTIRGMLGHPKHLELRNKLQNGEITGPRFITSGPSLNGNSVRSADAGSQMVRDQKNAGYDFLKIHPGISKENFAALANTAHEVGIPFAGHVPWDVGVWRAIDARYATIDHLDGFVESLVPDLQNIPEQQAGLFGMFIGDKADTMRIPALMKGLREKNIYVVPTQALAERWMAPADAETFRSAPEMKYMSKNVLDQWTTAKKNIMSNPAYNAPQINRYIDLRRKLIYELNKNNLLLLGSDAPQVFNVPGFSTHHELRYMVESGLSNYDALKSGTVNVGKFMQRPDIGVIKNGAVADLVLLNANPLTDIRNSTQIEGVMLNGKWLDSAWIGEILRKLEKN